MTSVVNFSLPSVVNYSTLRNVQLKPIDLMVYIIQFLSEILCLLTISLNIAISLNVMLLLFQWALLKVHFLRWYGMKFGFCFMQFPVMNVIYLLWLLQNSLFGSGNLYGKKKKKNRIGRRYSWRTWFFTIILLLHCMYKK